MADNGQTKKENQAGSFFEDAKQFLEYSERTMSGLARLMVVNDELQRVKSGKKRFGLKVWQSVKTFATKSETLLESEKSEESAFLFDQHKKLSDPLLADRKLLKDGKIKDIENLFQKYLIGSSKRKEKFFSDKKIPLGPKKHEIRKIIDNSLDNVEQYFKPKKLSLLNQLKVVDDSVEKFTKGEGLKKSLISGRNFIKGLGSNKALFNALKHVGMVNDIMGITDVVGEIENLGKEKNPYFFMTSAFKVFKNSVDFFGGLRELTKTKFVRKISMGLVEAGEKVFIKNLPRIGRIASKFGRVAKVFGGPVAEALSFAFDITDALKETDKKKREIKIGAAVGGAAGAIAAGALIGSIVPGAGTLVGAAVGMAGYYAGRYIGEYLGNPENRKRIMEGISSRFRAIGSFIHRIMPKTDTNTKFNPYFDALKLLNAKPIKNMLKRPTPPPRSKVIISPLKVTPTPTPRPTPSPLTSNGFSLNHDEIFGVMVRGMNKVIQNTA